MNKKLTYKIMLLTIFAFLSQNLNASINKITCDVKSDSNIEDITIGQFRAGNIPFRYNNPKGTLSEQMEIIDNDNRNLVENCSIVNVFWIKNKGKFIKGKRIFQDLFWANKITFKYNTLKKTGYVKSVIKDEGIGPFSPRPWFWFFSERKEFKIKNCIID